MIALTFWLLVGHCLADYPLQGDFLAKEKSPYRWPESDFPWQVAMIAHCLIHAGFVAALTGSLWLGLAEFGAHGFIDLNKAADNFGHWGPKKAIWIDQALHVACKILWAWILLH